MSLRGELQLDDTCTAVRMQCGEQSPDFMNRPKILFVCGRNQWRSPTAQYIYRNDPRLEARSAGVSDKSPHKISRADIQWADLILVMENEHKTRIQGLFGRERLPEIKSLDIPDEYEYMDEELIQLIKKSVEYYLKPANT